jgi:DNA-binding HxlR family transcriptional regulator
VIEPMVKRDYRQFCPVAKSLNVVGERWTLLLVRELLLGPRRYTDLRRALPGMASNLLAERLREMTEAGLVVRGAEPGADRRRPVEYVLTERGRALEPVLHELARFGLPTMGAPTEEEPLRPELVPLGLLALMHPAELPDAGLRARFALDEGDHVVEIEPRRPPGARRTLHERVDVHPTADRSGAVDATVTGSLVGLLWVNLGAVSLGEAVEQGLLRIEGTEEAVAALHHLYRLG